jgi:hypothetical protein
VVVRAGAGDDAADGDGPAGTAVDKEYRTSHQFTSKRGRFISKKLHKSRKKYKNTHKNRENREKRTKNALKRTTNCRKRRFSFIRKKIAPPIFSFLRFRKLPTAPRSTWSTPVFDNLSFLATIYVRFGNNFCGFLQFFRDFGTNSHCL